jgi:hypothetical protein
VHGPPAGPEKPALHRHWLMLDDAVVSVAALAGQGVQDALPSDEVYVPTPHAAIVRAPATIRNPMDHAGSQRTYQDN